MSNAQLTRIMNNARVHLPGALDDAIRQEMFGVLDDFFNGSSIWKDDITLGVTPDTDTYYAVPVTGQPIRLWGVVDGDGTQVPATMEEPGVVVLNNLPSQDATLTAKLVLTVTDPVSKTGYPECPGWILNKYQSTVIEGLLAHMMAQPAKPYTSERYAIFHARKFTSGISMARVEALHQNLQGGQRWAFPQGFATVSRK